MTTPTLLHQTSRSVANQRPHRCREVSDPFPRALLLLLIARAIGAQAMTMALAGKLSPNISLAWRNAMSCPCSPLTKVARTRPSGGRPFAAAMINGEAEQSSQSFYQRLNSPKHILAPMVSQSDLPFRLMCEQLHGVQLSYTQMIHAYNFVEENGETFRANHLDVYPQSTVGDILLGKEDRRKLLLTRAQANALKGLGEGEIEQARKRILASVAQGKGCEMVAKQTIEIKPTIVQIAGHDPDVAVKAAMIILERSGSLACDGASSPVAGIDLNLGCPQSIARKGRYGAFLHDDSPDVTYQVLSELRSKLPREIGVTAKIRLPPTQAQADAGRLGNMSRTNRPQTLDERMRCLIDCGVDVITVHGRTRFENKVAVGAADWDAIQQCVQSARAYSRDQHYPIFANGGIACYDDVQKCLDKTNASGVMSSEGLLEVPGVFCPGIEEIASSATAKDLLERQLGYADVYLDYATVFPPLSGSLGIKGGSFNVIRSHLFKFLHRYLEENKCKRSWLGNQELNTIKQARQLLTELRSRYAKIDEEQMRLRSSWSTNSSWYRRHRGPNTQQQSNNEPTPSLSLEEKKRLVKLRIRKMQEQRMKRALKSVS